MRYVFDLEGGSGILGPYIQHFNPVQYIQPHTKHRAHDSSQGVGHWPPVFLEFDKLRVLGKRHHSFGAAYAGNQRHGNQVHGVNMCLRGCLVGRVFEGCFSGAVALWSNVERYVNGVGVGSKAFPHCSMAPFLCTHARTQPTRRQTRRHTRRQADTQARRHAGGTHAHIHTAPMHADVPALVVFARGTCEVMAVFL